MKDRLRTVDISMMTGIFARCALGAALLFVFCSSAWSAHVLRAPEGGAVRAVVIGIDLYPNLDTAAQLRGAAADARHLSAALIAMGVPEGNVRTLTDGAGVRAQVIAALDRLVAESSSGDLAIVAYAGRGMLVRSYPRWEGLNHGIQSQILMSNYGPSDHGPSAANGHEVIVDAELRAWFARLDAKGVDVLAVLDTSFEASERCPCVPLTGRMMKRRRLSGPLADDQVHNSFTPIRMTEKEARADIGELPHVTLFQGATRDSTATEMNAIDPASPEAVRGPLSYFMARAFEGALADGKVTRGDLFRFLSAKVREATDGRQDIDFGPRTEDGALLQRVVFRIADAAEGGPQRGGMNADHAVEPKEPREPHLK
jgi:hypothetical protein